jgi:CheY-like chemotaxis protein
MQEEPPALRSLRVLVVEDHHDTAVTLARFLKRIGYEAKTAGSVVEAKRLVDGERFDVLLCDLGLPDGSGLDVMRHAKERRPEIVGIALSGYGLEEDIRESHAAGFAQHLTKPIDLQQLREAFSRV